MNPPATITEIDPIEAAVLAVSQPELFDTSGLLSPEDAELVRAGRRYAHTGSTVLKDEKRAMGICAARLLGWSDRAIARQFRCDARVVGLVVRAAEESGKLPAVKDVVMRLVADLALETGRRVQEVLHSDRAMDGELAQIISKLWVALGIATDKLAAPIPGSVHVHQHVHFTGDRVAAEWEQKLRAVAGGPIDPASIGLPPNAGESARLPESGVASGAAPLPDHRPGHHSFDLPAGQVIPAIEVAGPADQPGAGGGGCSAAGAPRMGNGFQRGDFVPNADHKEDS